MTAPAPSEYFKSKVLSASPAELRLMLLEGAIRFARQGRDGLAAKDWERAHNGFTRARDIILELVAALRPDIEPDLCNKLRGLYMFMFRRLVEANLEKNPELADEAIGLLEYERETWLMLLDKLAQDRQNAAASAPADRPALCVEA